MTAATDSAAEDEHEPRTCWVDDDVDASGSVTVNENEGLVFWRADDDDRVVTAAATVVVVVVDAADVADVIVDTAAAAVVDSTIVLRPSLSVSAIPTLSPYIHRQHISQSINQII